MTSTNPVPTFITITELSELIGVPVGTIRGWRKNGTGPVAYRIGGQLRYTITDVAAWIEASREDRGGAR